jgi:hypothetical protein
MRDGRMASRLEVGDRADWPGGGSITDRSREMRQIKRLLSVAAVYRTTKRENWP